MTKTNVIFFYDVDNCLAWSRQEKAKKEVCNRRRKTRIDVYILFSMIGRKIGPEHQVLASPSSQHQYNNINAIRIRFLFQDVINNYERHKIIRSEFSLHGVSHLACHYNNMYIYNSKATILSCLVFSQI